MVHHMTICKFFLNKQIDPNYHKISYKRAGQSVQIVNLTLRIDPPYIMRLYACFDQENMQVDPRNQ